MTPPGRFPWTDEHLASLRRMAGRGCSAGQIAEALGGGLSRNAVCGKAWRLGLTLGGGDRLQQATRIARGEDPTPRPTPGSRERAGLVQREAAIFAARARRDLEREAKARGAAEREAARQAVLAAAESGDFPESVPLHRARFGQCRYPLWGATAVDCDAALVCGADVRDPACAWCAGHAAIVFRPSSAGAESAA